MDFNLTPYKSLNEKSKAEVVTAFSGVLELDRRNKVFVKQEKLFGDIEVSRNKNAKIDDEIFDEDIF